MSQSEDKLAAIAKQLADGVKPQSETVRSFLSWFNAERRGFRVVREVRNAIRKYGLATVPDFEWTYLDGPIEFRKAPPEGKPGEALGDQSTLDPTYRIGFFASANRAPVYVAPDAPIQQIVTLMMLNDYSQIPVMTSPRELKGVVSWKSIATRLALNQPCSLARDCMERNSPLQHSDPLFTAFASIAAHDFALVQAADKTICGIVTASDLNEQFRMLAEPFLLLGEIENGVRRLLHGKFTPKELEAVKAPGDDNRAVATIVDLTFGEYVRLIENESNWVKLGINIHRAEFVVQIAKVRDIRNDVMHFDPDGLDGDDLALLRKFAQFLMKLREVCSV